MSNEFDNEYENKSENINENTRETEYKETQSETESDIQRDPQTDSVYSMKKEDLQYNHWEAKRNQEDGTAPDAEQVNFTTRFQTEEGQYYKEESAQTESGFSQGTDDAYRNQEQEQKPYGYYYEAPKGVTPPTVSKMARKKFFKKAMALVLSAAVFGVVAGACFQAVNYVSDQINPRSGQTVLGTTNTLGTTTTINSTTVTGAVSGDSDVSDIVENTMPSIVSITSTVSQSVTDFFGRSYSEDAEGSGSGIIVGKNDTELLIATNNHVVADSKSIKVTFIDNEVVNATVKGTDKTADLAVVSVALSDLKKSTLDTIKVANIGDSAKTKVGEMVIAIGNALGYGQSVTVGYISAKDREVTVDNNTMTLLQTDAAINPGNSGGALLNANGQLIGINSVKYASSEVEGMGYAIPISKALPIINELMNKVPVKAGEEGYLGINGQSVAEDMAAMYNMPVGAYVINVSEGSAAEKAGILPGDIITGVNGESTLTMEAVKEKVNGNVAGTKVTITLQRRTGAEYKEMKIDVVLQKLDEKTRKNLEDAANEAAQNAPSSDQESDSETPFGYDLVP